MKRLLLVSVFILAGFAAANISMALDRTSQAPSAFLGEPLALERPACIPTGNTCYTTFVTGKCCTGWCQCYLDPKTRRCRNTLGQCASNDGTGPLP